MKNVFKTLAVALTALVLVSCGGNSADSLVGSWHADVNSLDLQLGEGIPAEIKEGIESEKGEAIEEAAEESEGISIEFTKEGKVILSKEGEEETFSLDYAVEGDKLSFKGEIEGEKIDVYVTLADASADKFTISLSGEDVLAQIKAQQPEMLGMAEGMDLDAMAKGTSVSMSFKK